ncbi:cytochrome P450 [Winogradskyella alexanderae]|uniref:Cytochrome P450 n=1 Tax=Winogradskyella alexanderae TaxID=2877123 RepID=A0ABS7XT34_9FLAO|nr:cytochrome P450 [Winogradskyella alexanderae]MCA0133165.1 cytochrome P450 [Winogradskyella alexanderae]
MKKKEYSIAFFILIFFVFAALFFARNGAYFFSEPAYQSTTEFSQIAEKESCFQCHQDTKGYSKYHNPEFIGCAGCHLGNIASNDKNEAHKGMVLIPGNLSDAKETCGKCHPSELYKIEQSLMTTNSGIVAVDKFVFGEADSLDYHYHIKDLGYSASDKHLRDLCANCHLGAEKMEYGQITQLSRGGGCNACHLNYSNEAKYDLESYLASNKKELPQYHPSTDIFVNDTHCFGCHSRSSRISTNYMGLQETLLEESDIINKTDYKVLQDKRVYKILEQDIHHTKGMLCIDCHSSHEVMGDGNTYAHAEQAVKLQCSDCHFKEKPNTIPYDSLDRESLLVFLHRDYKHHDKQIIVAEKDGHPLVNTFVDSLGNAFLIGKKDDTLYSLKPQSEFCSRDNAHQDVSCATCHSSWTPRCIGCHNEYDKEEPRGFDLLDKKYIRGQWKEYVAEFSSSLPAMGVRETEEGKHIEPAIPGMIMTIDLNSYSHNDENESLLFHRLYAPNSPHTTTTAVRDCKSCHSNSASLGYGNGILEYKIKNKKGTWIFTPEYALNENDSLPEDAWIPFLKEVDKATVRSTRHDFRPFSVNEQKRLLLVGACLQCHKGNSEVMQKTLNIGIDSILPIINKACILPENF